jgi:hypothetical protein
LHMPKSLTSTIEHLQFIIDRGETTARFLNKKEMNSVAFFCVGLIQRLHDVSESLKMLMENISRKSNLEFGAGIILRSALLDALISFNLYKIILQSESNNATEEEKHRLAKEYCEMMLADGLGQTAKYIKAARDTGLVDEARYRSLLQNFTHTHQRFFRPYVNDGSLPLLKNNTFLSPVDLFKRLAHTPELHDLSKIYDAYLFFSKYDHFGILYYDVVNQPFNEQIDRIAKGIEVMIGSFSTLHMALRIYHPDDFLIRQSTEIAAYLYEHIIAPVMTENSPNEEGDEQKPKGSV